MTSSFIHDHTNSELHLRKKIPVGILGATGSVGQRLVQLLSKHPWFDLVAVAASEKSVGKSYKSAVNWLLSTPLPSSIADLQLQTCEPHLPCKIVFSAVDSEIAGAVEEKFANHGYVVISMAKHYRMDPTVPLLIPEVNADHLALVKKQRFANGGMIITKPNCSVIGLALALRPLALEFGIEAAEVVTMQSISGAGFPGVPSISLLDNIIPYIPGEEEKLQSETVKVLGKYSDGSITPYPLTVNATCTRVPVTEGHLEVVSLKLRQQATMDQIKRAWHEFESPIQTLKLPTSPTQILYYFEEADFPQPKLHRELENGMAVAIGRLRPACIFDYSFVLLSHNTLRGAAGGAILTAELLVKNGFVYW